MHQLILMVKGHRKKSGKLTYELESDTMAIIHPDNADPLSEKNKEGTFQHMYGDINICGERFSVGLVFRVVNKMLVLKV